jgi:hypothetical protein
MLHYLLTVKNIPLVKFYLVCGHGCPIIAGLKPKIAGSARLRRRLIEIRIGLEQARLQGFEDFPGLPVGERGALHRGGIGEVTQQPQLREGAEPDGVRSVLVSIGGRRTRTPASV